MSRPVCCSPCTLASVMLYSVLRECNKIPSPSGLVKIPYVQTNAALVIYLNLHVVSTACGNNMYIQDGNIYIIICLNHDEHITGSSMIKSQCPIHNLEIIVINNSKYFNTLNNRQSQHSTFPGKKYFCSIAKI